MKFLSKQITPPEPSFKNVAPDGEGWYQYKRGKWRLVEEYADGARYFSYGKLLSFASDALQALGK